MLTKKMEKHEEYTMEQLIKLHELVAQILDLPELAAESAVCEIIWGMAEKYGRDENEILAEVYECI